MLLDSLLSSNYLSRLFLYNFFLQQHEVPLWRRFASSESKSSHGFGAFPRAQTHPMTNEQRKLCPNMGFSSGKFSSSRRATKIEQWGFSALLVQLLITFYLHWNWILNYYLMGSSVLSLGPLFITEQPRFSTLFYLIFLSIWFAFRTRLATEWRHTISLRCAVSPLFVAEGSCHGRRFATPLK